MSETLTIRNFGPIKDITLNLKEVNVFIGDQGTGKSTVAKLLIVFKNYSNNNFLGFKLDKFSVVSDELQKFIFLLKQVEIESFFDLKKSFLEYVNPFFEIKIENENCYIPAERIMVNNLAYSLNSLLLSKIPVNLPKLYLEFANDIDGIKKSNPRKDYLNVLGVDYKVINNSEFIELANGKNVDFKFASSGIHSAIPMLLEFDNFINKNISKFELPIIISKFQLNLPVLVIEELELNLFPYTQKNVISYIIEKFQLYRRDVNNNNKNYTHYRAQLLLTTHSPYLLTVLNNLMFAFISSETESFDIVNNVISYKTWLNPNDVSCYLFKNDGTCEDIMDYDLQQIKVEKIDEISEILSSQWHQLAEINFEKAK